MTTTTRRIPGPPAQDDVLQHLTGLAQRARALTELAQQLCQEVNTAIERVEANADSGVSSGRELLSVIEAGEHLGVSRMTVYRLIGEGALPTVKLGSVTRIRRSDLEALIEDSVRVAS